MEITKVGSRGYIFTFDELLQTEFACLTNVFVIHGEEHIFICDTYLGPAVMHKVLDYLRELWPKDIERKPFIIFNSHGDWDHIWGNCVFKNSILLSHQLCRKRIAKEGQRSLQEYDQFAQGVVEIVLPNLTFETEINFHQDGVRFFYTPGHTLDSASCYDLVDDIIFVGDNLEDPVPYISTNNLAQYQDTLHKYIQLAPKGYLPAHNQFTEDDQLVHNNLHYIDRLQLRDLGTLAINSDKFTWIHQSNLEILGIK